MSQDDTFSFRWGIPILDGGHTDIPNFFLDSYAAAGVTRQEFLVIIHLARYQYNMPESECRPSIGTVSRQLGYTKRALQKLLASLEERGLLERRYRSGETTVYDFSGFSRLMLESSTGGGELQFRGEPQFTTTHEPQFTRGVNPSSPKEEELKEEAEEKEKAAAGPSVVCSIHHTAMERHQKDGETWYSHRLSDGVWCKGAAGDVSRADPHATDRQRYGDWSNGGEV